MIVKIVGLVYFETLVRKAGVPSRLIFWGLFALALCKVGSWEFLKVHWTKTSVIDCTHGYKLGTCSTLSENPFIWKWCPCSHLDRCGNLWMSLMWKKRDSILWSASSGSPSMWHRSNVRDVVRDHQRCLAMAGRHSSKSLSLNFHKWDWMFWKKKRFYCWIFNSMYKSIQIVGGKKADYCKSP